VPIAAMMVVMVSMLITQSSRTRRDRRLSRRSGWHSYRHCTGRMLNSRSQLPQLGRSISPNTINIGRGLSLQLGHLSLNCLGNARIMSLYIVHNARSVVLKGGHVASSHGGCNASQTGADVAQRVVQSDTRPNDSQQFNKAHQTALPFRADRRLATMAA